MIHAYDKQYMDDEMRNLGEACDYAVNNCTIEIDDFIDMFIAGGIANQFGAGVPRFVSGMSGTELVWEVVELAQTLGCKVEDLLEHSLDEVEDEE